MARSVFALLLYADVVEAHFLVSWCSRWLDVLAPDLDVLDDRWLAPDLDVLDDRWLAHDLDVLDDRWLAPVWAVAGRSPMA